MKVCGVVLKEITPYERNPRKNRNAVDTMADLASGYEYVAFQAPVESKDGLHFLPGGQYIHNRMQGEAAAPGQYKKCLFCLKGSTKHCIGSERQTVKYGISAEKKRDIVKENLIIGAPVIDYSSSSKLKNKQGLRS